MNEDWQLFAFYTDCPKCGCNAPDVKYVPAIENGADEHLQRVCRQCGYTWPQRPLG